MKKFYLLIYLIFAFHLLINAQGVYQVWGTAQFGGAGDEGVLFNTDASGNYFHNRFDFRTDNPGGHPDEMIHYNGKFYGITAEGGENNVGVIFEWDPLSNAYTKKIDLSYAEGRGGGGLTLSGNKFYGLTPNGGAHDAGVIFEWDPASNIYTKQYDLDFSTGYFASGSLTLMGTKYYGITAFGGQNDAGVIFEWDPLTKVFTKKFDFDKSNGWQGVGSLQVKDDKLYGMTFLGGNLNRGVIFEYDPLNDVYTIKKDFSGTDGSRPFNNLTLHEDKFYGTTTAGGTNEQGVIFEWDPATNVYLKKVDLSLVNGRGSRSALIFNDGKFYGTTELGGINDQGVIFEWDPIENIYVKRVDLTTATGIRPLRNLLFANDKFYGTANSGGTNNKGVIFAWDPATNNYLKQIDFDYSNGRQPQAGLTSYGGKIYGATIKGGNNNLGVIYEWDPAANTYTKRINFSYADGYSLQGSLVVHEGKFYATTEGGLSNSGAIAEWDPVTNEYAKKIDFTFENGSEPVGGLTFYKGKAYGTTYLGGSGEAGVLFEWDPLTNVYTKKVELSANDISNGRYFRGGLALYEDKFYGLAYGGAYGAGIIYEWDPASNIYTKKFDVGTINGSNVQGGLTLYQGKFYGTTIEGGMAGLGVIFEWDPLTNIFMKKFDFDITNGSSPLGNLLLNNAKFYGITSRGGDFDEGVLFEWDPVSNVYVKKVDFSVKNGEVAENNELSLIPAPVASGLPGTCTNFPEITIDSTNNTRWVPVTDTLGNVVAEIKANGSNLGIVSSSIYINNDRIREDASGNLYLDRSITLRPEIQPDSAIDIRLYIKSAEYETLKDEFNSRGGPFIIDSINDVGIFLNKDGCVQALQNSLERVPASAASWQADYVFSGSADYLSSFYFEVKAPVQNIPPVISLITPSNNTNYLSGGDINLTAIASDEDGAVSKVEFYNDTTLLATLTNAPYTFTWQDVPAGEYELTAGATDNSGDFSTSAKIHISVISNKPPTVNIVSPVNNQTFLKGATVHIKALAADSDGVVTKVAFYNGSNLLKIAEAFPYEFNWRIGQAGNYVITARASDNSGAETISSAINISVVPNQLPIVSIISPANGQTFTATGGGATIKLEALASDADGRIAQVKFYSDSTLLTNEHKLSYTYLWENVPPGTYILTASAKDNWSGINFSSPITITVAASPDEMQPGRKLSFTTTKPAINEVLSLTILPNPAKNTVVINTRGLQKNRPLILSLLSASGITLKSRRLNSYMQQFPLDISSLPSGMYIIKVINGDKIIYGQFLKM